MSERIQATEAAYEAAKGRWTGREWDDPERVCPDWTDEQIVRALRACDGRLEVTRWGVPDDGSHEAQRWVSSGSASDECAGTLKVPEGATHVIWINR